MEAQLGQLGLEPLDHGHGGVSVEVIDDQDLERAGVGALDDAA